MSGWPCRRTPGRAGRPHGRRRRVDASGDPDHEVEYEPGLLREELAAAGWQMGEPTLRWGEIWAEATRT